MQEQDSSKPTLTITLPGYVPCTRNQLKGCHWTMLYKEKKRAGMALLNALKLSLLSIQCDPPIGMPTVSRSCRIFVSMLESYRGMDGKLFLVGSVPKRLSRYRNKKPL